MFISPNSNPGASSRLAFPAGKLDRREGEEWRAIEGERDSEMRAEQMLAFAGRLEQAGKLELAAEIYAALPSNPRAQGRLDLLSGRGSSGLRAEQLLDRFTATATDYKIILPMLAASVAYPLARSWGLGRLGALGAESTVFFAGQRGLRYLSGERLSWDESLLGREWLSTSLTLGILKLSGNVGRVLHPPAGARPALQFAASFGGLLGAHQLDVALRIRPRADGATTLLDTLGTWVSMSVGGHLAHRILGPGWGNFEPKKNSPLFRGSETFGLRPAPAVGPRTSLPIRDASELLAPRPLQMSSIRGGRGTMRNSPGQQMRELDGKIKAWIRSIEEGDEKFLLIMAEELGTHPASIQDYYQWARYRPASSWKKLLVLDLAPLSALAGGQKVRKFLTALDDLGSSSAYQSLFNFATERASQQPNAVFILEALLKPDRPEVALAFKKIEVAKLLDGAKPHSVKKDSFVLALNILARHRNPPALSALHRLAVEDPHALLILRSLAEEGHPGAKESLMTLEPKFLLIQAFDGGNKTALLAAGLLAQAKNIHVMSALFSAMQRNPKWMDRLLKWNKEHFEGASFLVQDFDTLMLGEHLRASPGSSAKELLEHKAAGGDEAAAKFLQEWEKSGALQELPPTLPPEMRRPSLRGVSILRYPPRTRLPILEQDKDLTWVLLNGEVEVRVGGDITEILESGAFSRSMDPRWGRERLVTTRVPSLVMKVDRNSTQAWTEPGDAHEFYPSPLRQETWREKILKTFHELPAEFVDRMLWRGGRVFSYRPGEYVARQGEPAEHLFFVLEGQLRSYRFIGHRAPRLVGPGEIAGEISLIPNRTHPRILRAVQPSHVLRIPAEGLRLFPQFNPHFRRMAKREH